MSDEPHYTYVDVPVVNGIAVLPDHTEVRSTANVVRVPVLVGRLGLPDLLFGKDAPDSLDAAWAEAEAALPEGWEINLYLDPRAEDITHRYGVNAGHPQRFAEIMVNGPTPAAALRALEAKLRGL
jgi:hypothetical protein